MATNPYAVHSTTSFTDRIVLRCIAVLIDSIIISALTLPLVNVLTIPDPKQAMLLVVSSLPASSWLMLGVTVVYFTCSEWLFSTTIGKYWLGLQVIRADGQAIGFKAAVVRNVLRLIDAFLLIGFFVLCASPTQQRLGDQQARTLVVERRYFPLPMTRQAFRRRLAGIGTALLLLTIGLAAFDYFGRPPLIIAGDFQAARTAPHSTTGYSGSTFTIPATMLFGPCVTSYQLGNPIWGGGTVRYPITYFTNTTPYPRYDGTVELAWGGPLAGWELRFWTGVTCP